MTRSNKKTSVILMKLCMDHIQEVLDKWTQIDDEIWAKVIVLERNRRVAKAYARAPVLTINGSDDGFDGMRIGLCGFDNPMRDQRTEEIKKHIGQGVKIKMDDAGNILVRRYSKSNVYIKSCSVQNGSEAEPAAIPLEPDKIVKLFDMKRFEQSVSRELRRSYPDRRRLETACLSTLAFVLAPPPDQLATPLWVLVVNVVAMDMLKTKLPMVSSPQAEPAMHLDIRTRPRIPAPDEDPYSHLTAGGVNNSNNNNHNGNGVSNHHGQMSPRSGNDNGSSSGGSSQGGGNGSGAPPVMMRQTSSNGYAGSSTYSSGYVASTRELLLAQRRGGNGISGGARDRPPELPPRERKRDGESLPERDIPKPDYDDIEEDVRIQPYPVSRGSHNTDKGKNNKKYDDPYYCGLRARVPNFVKSTKQSSKQQQVATGKHGPSNGLSNNNNKRYSMAGMGGPSGHMGYHHQQYPPVWHARSYESGIDSESIMTSESPYHHIYGRLPLPNRGYLMQRETHNARSGLYIGEWD
ncbi:uncharacterized protein LOC113374655 [Ctenocephalides felis]|uniref:uncharacterized protein LOC113374655 n=1 Tax=Ctenocephalides felis TaxID=7515 RepID=UPI000E6E2B63|nr:uncharacterized protein LOC113374655 [Ctenocephalides felis]